jgi:tetratricopeptide (TPR) repeat protein
MRDHNLALKYFKHLQSLPGNIIVHSNAHIAECLLKFNRKREALSYLREELKIYPVSLVALYNKLRLEKKMGLTAEAESTTSRLFNTLKFKGLNLNDLKKILSNPELDGRYYLLKEN